MKVRFLLLTLVFALFPLLTSCLSPQEVNEVKNSWPTPTASPLPTNTPTINTVDLPAALTAQADILGAILQHTIEANKTIDANNYKLTETAVPLQFTGTAMALESTRIAVHSTQVANEKLKNASQVERIEILDRERNLILDDYEREMRLQNENTMFENGISATATAIALKIERSGKWHDVGKTAVLVLTLSICASILVLALAGNKWINAKTESEYKAGGVIDALEGTLVCEENQHGELIYRMPTNGNGNKTSTESTRPIFRRTNNSGVTKLSPGGITSVGGRSTTQAVRVHETDTRKSDQRALRAFVRAAIKINGRGSRTIPRFDKMKWQSNIWIEMTDRLVDLRVLQPKRQGAKTTLAEKYPNLFEVIKALESDKIP